MCTSASPPKISRISSNGELTIDRTLQPLDGKTAASLSPADEVVNNTLQDSEDPMSMDTLTSSFVSTYLNFGIFDSVQLTKQQVRVPLSADSYDADSDDDLQDLDLSMIWGDEEGDLDSFHASTSSFVSTSSTRKRGVRRGYQETTAQTEDSTTKHISCTSTDSDSKILLIPVKNYDGPSSTTAALDIVPMKQAPPPAAWIGP